MLITNVTIVIPVTDLNAACSYYQSVLELNAPDASAEGVVEYSFGGFSLQLNTNAGDVGEHGVELVFSVIDVVAECNRIAREGIEIGAIETGPNGGQYVDLTDPDGNTLWLSTEQGSQELSI